MNNRCVSLSFRTAGLICGLLGWLSVASLRAQAPVGTGTNVDTVVALSSLDLGQMLQEFASPQANRSVQGRFLQISGQRYTNGVGTHARSVLWVDLHGAARRFNAVVGIDDEVVSPIVQRELRHAYDTGLDEYRLVNGRVCFQIYGDGRLLWKSRQLQTAMPAEPVDVDLTGVQNMVLIVSSLGEAVSYDDADWADARFTVRGAPPKTIPPPREEPYLLTPMPAATPRINGAAVFGVRPGSPFLFTIAATGEGPLRYAAKALPSGLHLDAATGRITGQLKHRGEWRVPLEVRNARGVARRDLKIVCGDTLALTPPMGWNSWNVFGREPTEARVKAAADAMVACGLINHGWTYVNIDDCWQHQHSSKNPQLQGPGRDAAGRVLPNQRFPDMKAVCDYIHARGLKAGIYSSPGMYTCAGYTGSFQHEAIDARQYADWGFDYLKYDWCYNTHTAPDVSLQSQRAAWQTMAQALVATHRDLVFSLSETLDVWPWAKDVGANCWRTTGDITDTWSSMDEIGFNQNGREIVAGPGHWNDCDMFVVGKLGGGRLHYTRLSPDELYTHISLWCLLASPLLIGCDMTQMDDFTLNLLTNDEVLEVNQDPLGKQARRISKDENVEVWAKTMADGSLAVGLFNRGEFPAPVTVRWTELGLPAGSAVPVRDLWPQRDLGPVAGSFTATIPRHGVRLIRTGAGRAP